MSDLVLASVCVCVLVCVGVSSAQFEHFPFQRSQPTSHHEVPFHQRIVGLHTTMSSMVASNSMLGVMSMSTHSLPSATSAHLGPACLRLASFASFARSQISLVLDEQLFATSLGCVF